MNKWLFLQINGLSGHNLPVDQIVILMAKYMPYLFILFAIYLFVNKKTVSIVSIQAAVIGLIVNWIIGLIYFEPRPFVSGIGHAIISHSADASFPSDHTTLMAAIAVSLLFYKRWIGVLFLLLALVGGLSRVYVGIHYPFDIGASFVVGFFSAIFARKFFKIDDKLFSIAQKKISDKITKKI